MEAKQISVLQTWFDSVFVYESITSLVQFQREMASFIFILHAFLEGRNVNYLYQSSFLFFLILSVAEYSGMSVFFLLWLQKSQLSCRSQWVFCPMSKDGYSSCICFAFLLLLLFMVWHQKSKCKQYTLKMQYILMHGEDWQFSHTFHNWLLWFLLICWGQVGGSLSSFCFKKYCFCCSLE